jgi:hypothetical protein
MIIVTKAKGRYISLSIFGTCAKLSVAAKFAQSITALRTGNDIQTVSSIHCISSKISQTSKNYPQQAPGARRAAGRVGVYLGDG